MLGQDVVPARYLRDDHARCKRFGHDPSLDLIAPPPATTRTDLDVDPTPWLRTVDYMLNHICEPICVRCVACCRSARGRQGGGRRPLTVHRQSASAESTVRVSEPIGGGNRDLAGEGRKVPHGTTAALILRSLPSRTTFPTKTGVLTLAAGFLMRRSIKAARSRPESRTCSAPMPRRWS